MCGLYTLPLAFFNGLHACARVRVGIDRPHGEWKVQTPSLLARALGQDAAQTWL